MKKVNLQTLTYDRLQQSEMNKVKGGTQIKDELAICPYCKEEYSAKNVIHGCIWSPYY